MNNTRRNPGTLVSAAYSVSTFVLQAVFQNNVPDYHVSPLTTGFYAGVWMIGALSAAVVGAFVVCTAQPETRQTSRTEPAHSR